jgi:hypothetical protein
MIMSILDSQMILGMVRAATLIWLFSSVVVRAQNASGNQSATPEMAYRISGTIVSAVDGRPLGKTRVSLVEATNRVQAVWMVTAENGHFEFNSVPAGRFALEGAKRGFLTAGYQQHEQFSTAIVTGAGFNTENLILRLMPLGLLAGRVIDEAGDAVRNARVSLYVESHRSGFNRIVRAGNDSTDDQGSYEFAELAPGNYYVSAAAKPWYAVHPSSTYVDGVGSQPPTVARSLDVAYPTTFYNGAVDSASATAIPVKGGDHVQVDIHLSPVPALHLFVRTPTESERIFNMPMIRKPVFDMPEFVQAEGAGAVAPGVMELVGIPAGKYSVTSRMSASRRLAQGVEMNLTKDGQELEVPPNEPSGTVKVSVKMARGEPIPQGLSLSLRKSPTQFAGSEAIGPGGEVTFGDVPPGKYEVLVGSLPPPPYTITRITSQGVETAGRDVTVAAGASLELSASIVAGVVGVEGFAKRAGKPMSGVMVALVPKDPETHPERFRRDQSDMEGGFAFRNILPGSYTIISVEDAWEFPWMEAGALPRYLQHGQNVTIGELMNGTVLLPDPVEVQPR